MAAVRDVPHIAGNVMPICSWHFAPSDKERFGCQKQHSKAINAVILSSLLQYFK
jgi:hypothetical protein